MDSRQIFGKSVFFVAFVAPLVKFFFLLQVSLNIDEVKDMIKSFGDLLDTAKDTMKTENIRSNEQEKEENKKGVNKSNKKMNFKWNRRN